MEGPGGPRSPGEWRNSMERSQRSALGGRCLARPRAEESRPSVCLSICLSAHLLPLGSEYGPAMPPPTIPTERGLLGRLEQGGTGVPRPPSAVPRRGPGGGRLARVGGACMLRRVFKSEGNEATKSSWRVPCGENEDGVVGSV